MIEQHTSLTEKFLKKGFWLYIFSFIVAPIWYIVKIIISGELSVSDVWILYWIISLVTMISVYNDLGMSESLKHFIPKFYNDGKYREIKSILFYALLTQIISSLIIVAILFFWSNWLAIHYFNSQNAADVLKVFAFFFLGINIFQTVNNFFLAIQDTFWFQLTELLRMWAILIFVLFLFFGGFWNLQNYSIGWLIGLYFWILICLSIFYKKYYQKYFINEKIIWNKELGKQMFSYAWMVFLWTSVWTVLSQLDMQMIIYFLGTTEAGYYTNYLSIIWIPFILIWPIFWLLFPVFSELYSKWEIEKIRLSKHVFTKFSLSIGIMFNIFLFIFAEQIAYTLFGEKFITSWVILKYSVLFLVFNFLLQINFNILAWIWRVKERVKIITIALFFNAIANIICIKLLWVYGAALATGVGWLMIYIMSDVSLGKEYKVSIDYKNIIKNIFVLWLIWFFLFQIEKLYFVGISRIATFGLILVFWILWLCFFIMLNYTMFQNFIWEIKKIKKWNI